MDHAVKAEGGGGWSRLVDGQRFQSSELESLFQRYAFKLQHGSVTAVVCLFVLLTAALAYISFIYTYAFTAQNLYHLVHCVLFVILLLFLSTK